MLSIYKLKKKDNLKITAFKKGDYAGEKKHYPAATKEWFNSIYSFNKNSIKSLPSADIYVTKLIKSYFNLFNLNFEKNARLHLVRFKKRRFNMNKIIVGKPEFKHTNDKVIITLFVFNQEIINLKNKIDNLQGLNYLNIFSNKFTNKVTNNNLKLKIDTIKNIYTNFFKEIKQLNQLYLKNLKSPFLNIQNLSVISLIKKILVKIRLYIRIKKLIFLNQSKFKSIHILHLRNFLQKIYGKNVEFNIVNLKRYNLNSSILTQIMATKLRNRKNRILRVIDKILTRVNLPFTRRLQYPAKTIKVLNTQNLIIRNNINKKHFILTPNVKLNKIRDLSNNTLKKVTLKNITKDKLNMLLKSIYPKQYIMKVFNNKLIEKIRSLENTVLDNIKNKVVSGVRIEASGRLSKRLIASRAVFKMRQKGTIRNINSSYKKIPSVLLRGKLTSNLDFSKSNNKTRIGAFGLKGWISST